MKITITKKLHFNTGDFSNVEACITVEEEVSAKDFAKKYEALSNIAGACLALESASVLSEMYSAREATPKNYGKSLEANEEAIKESIAENLAIL